MNRITVETDKQEYLGGEEIHGRCTAHIDAPIEMRGLRVRLHGFERSHWTSGSGKSRHTHSQTRDFFKEEITLLGRPPLSTTGLVGDALKGLFAKGDYETLPAGEYSHEFSYRLPPELPADYESGGPSRIAYLVTAYVDLPLKADLSSELRLGVREPFDPQTVRPAAGETVKRFLFQRSTPLSMSVALERDTFCANDRVRGGLAVLNESGKRPRRIIVELLRTIRLRAGSSSSTRSEGVPLGAIPDPVIERGTPAKFDLDFAVPPNLASTSIRGELVKVSYELVVSLDVPWALDPKVRIPVTIVE